MWLKLDDRFPDNPKIEALSDAAYRFHTAVMCDCAAFLTDGYVSPTKAAKRGGQELIDECIAAGLWTSTGDGWQINDWLEFNEPAEKIKERRRREAEKKAAQRAKGSEKSDRGGDGRFVSPGESPGDNPRDNPGESRGESSATRPVPSRPRKNTRAQVDERFEGWWSIYPKKVDRGAAERAWPKALLAVGGDVGVLVRAAVAYRDDPKRDPDFTKNPATWLNAKAWLNQPATTVDAHQAHLDWLNRPTA